ncbi:hypothetical protein acdb102_19600 [Acidothermaceae bacterium B102]|nr:hypothetical protein acdb102_19600 [Acidothermaceae bacterium B102]
MTTTPEGGQDKAESRRGFLVGMAVGALLVVLGVGVGYAMNNRSSGTRTGASAPTTPSTSTSAEVATTPLTVASSASSTVTATPRPRRSRSRVDNDSEGPTSGGSTSGGPAASPGAAVTNAALPDSSPVSCPAATVNVTTAVQLTAALHGARPGTVIALADGTYLGNFLANVPGTKDAPIYLCGGRGAVLDGGNVKIGYVLHLQGADYWRVVGFSVRNAQKGVVADATSHSVVQGLSVTDVGDEGIHLRAASSFNVVAGNVVARTGLLTEKFGEGIYIGSARKNWPKYGIGGGPDRSDYNVVRGNTISATTAENVDIKEGTTGGLLEGNTFDGAGGLTAADSWVDVKGNNWRIANNTGTHSPNDGFQTHQILPGWGTGNVFSGNHSVVDGPGYGIHLTNRDGNTVTCDNTVSGAGAGSSNVTCSG